MSEHLTDEERNAIIRAYIAIDSGDFLIRNVKRQRKVVKGHEWHYSCVNKKHKCVLEGKAVLVATFPWLEEVDKEKWKADNGYDWDLESLTDCL